MNVVDLPRMGAALAALDRLVAAHPELRGEAARVRLAALLAADQEHEGDLDTSPLAPANDS